MARLALLLTLTLACAPRLAEDATDATVLRTADPYKRGLTDADFPRVKRLADGVYSYEQLRSAGDEKFTTVSMFVVTKEGVLVADGQGSVAETGRMLDEIRTITPLPVTHVVIGSDHGDHTAGNAAFPRTARFLIHPTSKATLGATAATMDEVRDTLTLNVGGREIRILFLGRAHTGGDLMVHLPKEKILFMSEAYLNRVFPAMRSAYPSEWLAMLDRAIVMDVRTFVPGHGFVDSPAVLREELVTYRNALAAVIAEGRRLHAAGVPVEDAVAQARFGDLDTWSLRSSQGAIAIRRVYMELNGELR
jgi:cyclase